MLCARDGMSTLEDLILIAEDFPPSFHGVHDYAIARSPVTPRTVYLHIRGRHNRLWYSTSWRVADGEFLNFSFLIDTGAPKDLYLCDAAVDALERHGLLKVDEDMSFQYVLLFGRKVLVEPTPAPHRPANIMGLKLLKRFGLELMDAEPHFAFKHLGPVLTADRTEHEPAVASK